MQTILCVINDHFFTVPIYQFALKMMRRFPTVLQSDPLIWFIQVDAFFGMSNISEDKRKFSELLFHLEAKILVHVVDVLQLPEEEQTYALLKKRIIATLNDLEAKRLKKVIHEWSLVDTKPSALFGKMRQLAGNLIAADALQLLWLQKMPREIRRILEMGQWNEGGAADGIEEAADLMHDLLAERCKLAKTLGELRQSINEIIRSLSHFNRESMRPICFFHKRFGMNSTRCKGRCSFPKPLRNPDSTARR